MTQSFQDIQRAFAAHIRNPEKFPVPEGIEARRAKVYSDLFYNNVEGFVARTFPVIKQIFGEQKWHAMVREFFETHHCHSPFFSDISKEFLLYLQKERNNHEDPPFLQDLAHYEWCELALEISQLEIPESGFNPTGNLLKGQILLSPLAWVLHYQWPVHLIAPDFQPEQVSQPCFLIMYRNRQDQIRFMQTNAISARLLSIIQEQPHYTGKQALESLATELSQLNQPVDINSLLEHGEQTLKQFLQHSIILGTQIQAIK